MIRLVAALVFALSLQVAAQPDALADGGADHQMSLSRPIPLGVSGGSADDLDGFYCCGGTLGGVVEDCSGEHYILSNNHVLGRTNRAVAGEDVVQPALIDSGCGSSAADVVADFTEFIEIEFNVNNTVDAAIAKIRSGEVDTSGVQLDIGPVSPSVASAGIGMAVQKDGRTTGHTTGTVVATDVTTVVSYPKKCGGRGGPGAVMEDQIRVSDGSFSAGGDSGSVVYSTDPTPRPVGLLFAGSSTSTIANKISNVLDAGWTVGPLAMAGGTPQGCSGGCSSNADCDDADACTNDVCAGSACQHTPVNCDDGDACTDDLCTGGACGHPPISCDDGDLCTADSCDAGSGCSNDPIPTCSDPCGDGVCDVASEDCASCPDDCAGLSRGKKSNRFCCGRDTDCSDARCTQDGGCTGTLGGSTTTRGRGVAEVAAVKSRHSRALLALEDVVGHGVGRDDDGNPVIEVYLARSNANARGRVPRSLEGVAVRTVVTGAFTAY